MNYEDGRHPLASNAWVDVTGDIPSSVTHRESESPIQDGPFKAMAKILRVDELAAAVEKFLPVWVEPIEDADFSIDAGSVPETRSALLVLSANQPTHVRQMWWPEGETMEGHPTYGREAVSVRVVAGVALGRDGLPVSEPRVDAESRLVPVAT